jgi:hypothetical protein
MIKTSIKLTHYLAAASLLAVFIIDVFTPTEFVADILYLCCILIVFKENTQTIIGFAVVACMLIVADVLFIDMKLHPSLSHYVNRGMSILAILITAYIATRYRKLSQAGIIKRRQHLNDLKQMLFITSHQVRKPVANILGIIDVINNDSEDLSVADIKKRCRYLYSSAGELDKFIKQLNTFIEQTEEQDSKDVKIPSEVEIFTAKQNKVNPVSNWWYKSNHIPVASSANVVH